MLDNPSMRYEGEKAFRQAAEKTSKVSVSDAVWSDLEPGFPPYDELDLTEKVNALRAFSDLKPKTSKGENVREGRRARVERAAIQTRKLVEAHRFELFGHTNPKFPNQGYDAAKWIEGQVEEPQTERLAIEVTIPAHLKPMERLVWVIDHLAGKLDSWPSTGNGDGAVAHFMKYSGHVRDVGWSIPVLEYVWINADGEIEIRKVKAPDGSDLGRLQDISDQLAKILDWKQYAAVHHLLTGGVVSHSGVLAAFRSRSGRRSFGDLNPMTLTIPDPGSVTNKELVTAFQKAKSHIPQPLSKPRRQRARIASKSEKATALVEETPRMPWDDRLKKFNLQYPEDRFSNVSAIKAAYYSRAHDT